MTQYEKAHVISKIDGYFAQRPSEDPERAFLRAKQETLAAYQRTLANIEALTWEEFRAGRKTCERDLTASGATTGEVLGAPVARAA